MTAFVKEKIHTETHYRSGAVARMLQMPVATLRIWERRYQVSTPDTTPSGHRLYSQADVQRLALLKQLTDNGHAIGSVAALSLKQLQTKARTHVNLRVVSPRGVKRAVCRVVVVGHFLAQRLSQPGVVHRLLRAIEVVQTWPTVASVPCTSQADILLISQPSLQLSDIEPLQALAQKNKVAVLYGYSTQAACDALVASGVALLHEPKTDAELASWLSELMSKRTAPAAKTMAMPMVFGATIPRRFDDLTLMRVASLASTVKCECPQHLAQLLMQLSHFEAYSADCASITPADAALHAQLGQAAACARGFLEAAFDQLALHEGLTLTNQPCIFKPGVSEARV
jgi:MerR family transcriptional regulator, light-induced transcriptional regulator